MIAATALSTKAKGLAKLATCRAIALLGAPVSLLLSPSWVSDPSPVAVASDDVASEELVLVSVGLAMVVFLDNAVPVAALPLAPVPTAPPKGTVVVLLLAARVVVVLVTMTDWTTPPVALEEGEELEVAVAEPDEDELEEELAVLPVRLNGPE